MNKILLWLDIQRIRIKTLLAYQKSWRELPIEDNGESLVLLPSEFCYPFYAEELKITNDKRVFLRSSVVEMFFEARKNLNILGYDLKVYDGWRPLYLQENLFWYYMNKFTIPKYEDCSEFFKNVVNIEQIKYIFFNLPEEVQKNLKEINRTYVSWPSKDFMSPSPHITGGAIDVWLYKNDKPVNLGVPFDWMEETSGAFYHLKIKRKKFIDDKNVSYYRSLLLYAMTQAGFSCYGPEIWHFNYGNQMDSLVSGRRACYSYIEPL